ncbi:MAG: hypothetical protein V1245_00730 [Arenicellales bacterium]|jgi:DUF971 family protein|nr:hypothetical protein [Arenicellales bacterium]MDP6313682.1 hypothetical protein [Arenicellales bacterium]MDP7119969.1 hypothetical protein [Arenicellales bacterium]MDP7192999.1 hypothetical protein [Arenicellales bacterium]MDP7490780.1 hypothetical protein [Arenicellales bacterium]
MQFDDGHDTSIYWCGTLYDLTTPYQAYWQARLKRLEQAQHPRNEMAPGPG